MSEVVEPTSKTIALIGASNLTRGISVVVETLRLQHGSPLRIVAALGHGRSYGMRSSILGRSLCSILDCGIWPVLERHPPQFALLTDIGNDIMYGASPHAIAGWLTECVKRLERSGVERINISALPLDSIRSVKRWQFGIVRSVLFPKHNITYEAAIECAFETQALIEELALRKPNLIRLIEHDRAWYLGDPIHIRHTRKPEAWAQFLWNGEDRAAEHARGSFDRWQRLRRHWPQRYSLLGIDRECPQPMAVTDSISIEMH